MAPKRQALEEANAELAEAQEKLSRIKNKIAVSAGDAGGHVAAREDPATPTPHTPALGRSRPGLDLPSCSSSQELNANLSNLTSAFEKATAEKIKCQQEADATNRVISLANR